jgi:hypothetical protein
VFSKYVLSGHRQKAQHLFIELYAKLGMRVSVLAQGTSLLAPQASTWGFLVWTHGFRGLLNALSRRENFYLTVFFHTHFEVAPFITTEDQLLLLSSGQSRSGVGQSRRTGEV